MSPVAGRVLRTLALAACASVVGAAADEIRHEPLRCVPADRFVRILAQGTFVGVLSAELQFRSDPTGPWYAIPMRAQGSDWAALLPRTTSELDRFEYRIVMAGPGAQASESNTFAVDVRSDASACGSGAAQLSVSSPIEVRVPPGAPVVPPVPDGFNPAGVVPAQEREPASSKKTLALLGGLGAVGLAGAVLAAASEDAAPAEELPDFAFNGTSPSPDNTVSLSRGGIQVLVRMSREPATPLDFTWRVDWRQSAAGLPCVSMGHIFIGAQSPRDLVLSAPLVSSGSCGERFDASLARITIQVSGRIVWDVTLELPFHFEP